MKTGFGWSNPAKLWKMIFIGIETWTFKHKWDALRMLFNTVGRFRKKAHRPWQ
jgi:hypothetical protein